MLPPLCEFQLNGSRGAAQNFVMLCLVNPSSEKSTSETQGAEETIWPISWMLYLRRPSFHFGFFGRENFI